MRRVEPGEGEANGGAGAPLADAGQRRRTRWSFVIPPLGGRGLFSRPGRGPEAGRPLVLWSLGRAR